MYQYLASDKKEEGWKEIPYDGETIQFSYCGANTKEEVSTNQYNDTYTIKTKTKSICYGEQRNTQIQVYDYDERRLKQ